MKFDLAQIRSTLMPFPAPASSNKKSNLNANLAFYCFFFTFLAHVLFRSIFYDEYGKMELHRS